MVRNSRVMLLWDFMFQTDKQRQVNQPDMVVADKEQKRAVVTDLNQSQLTMTSGRRSVRAEGAARTDVEGESQSGQGGGCDPPKLEEQHLGSLF